MPAIAPIIGIVRQSINVDGNGVCTLVAFHTCTLACKYCLNPQSLAHPEKCEQITPHQLYEKVKIDDLYFQATGGGITFGGGEPMLRSEFILEFKKICNPAWRICLETALNVPTENLQKIAPAIHHFYIDIKDLNPHTYRRYTGADLTQVNNNLNWLAANGLAHQATIRVPLISGFNTPADQQNSIAILQEMGFKNFDTFSYITRPKKNNP